MTTATLTESTPMPPRKTPYEIRDKGGRLSVKGLLLRAQPSGVRTYYVEIARGKREKIGDASNWTLKRARNEAARIIGLHQDGKDFQAERREKKHIRQSTLGTFLDGPFKEHAEANIASHRDMIGRVKKSFAALLKKPMGEITEFDLRRWRKNRDGVALETVKREFTYLRAILNYAVKTKAIPSHQVGTYRVTGTIAEGESSAQVRFLTTDEEKRLRAALDAREVDVKTYRETINASRRKTGRELLPALGLDDYADHIKPMVLLALNTGLRRGDLFDLKWQHVDLGRRQIRKVINKSSHAKRKAGKKVEPVTLPISDEAHAVLSQLKRQRDPNSDYVFPSPVSGSRLNNIKRGVNTALKLAKIDEFRFHDLRHTFASRLVMAGVDVNTVRELMTHSDIKMTLVYAHLTDDHKSAALERAFAKRS